VVIFARVTEEQDWEVIIDDARVALIANPSILALTKNSSDPPSEARIQNEVYKGAVKDPTPSDPPNAYITLTLVSTVSQSDYNRPRVNTLLDIGIYSNGWSTSTVRTLIHQCIKSLVVDPWPNPTLIYNSVSMRGPGTGLRPASTLVNGVMRRGRQLTLRIIASKPPS
jgi:hypothetical protein